MPGLPFPELPKAMRRETIISYWLMLLLLAAVGWLGMAVPFLAVLFSFFALEKLNFGQRRILSSVLFITLVTCMGGLLYYFTKQAYISLPKMVETTIPVVLGFAEKQGLELPFSDYSSLKALALETAKAKFAGLGKGAQIALVEVASTIIGIVVAVSVFNHPAFELDSTTPGKRRTLYSGAGKEMAERISTFYESFVTVMGAQIAISAINTTFTSVFLIYNDFPYVTVIIGLTFLVGLLPIIGNLISNTLITGVAFTISPKMAALALLFLIVLHKFEYFLNSKIIGHKIKNPMWLTLLGLLLGEKLMGIPGMILAPVTLHYIKTELSRPIWNLPEDHLTGHPPDAPHTESQPPPDPR